MALHRPGQTHAERFHRELQWALEGRTPERDAVHVTGPCSRCPRMLAGRLQRRSTTLATWMEHAFRVRLHLPSAPGSGAALCRGLRASSRRSNRPTGQSNRQERTHRWIKLGGNITGTVQRRPAESGGKSWLKEISIAWRAPPNCSGNRRGAQTKKRRLPEETAFFSIVTR